ncbi:MAG: hypothetical protein IJO57_00910 [Bacilli bacterium]|nr:hypothetical protein [Bacilli bacterium]
MNKKIFVLISLIIISIVGGIVIVFAMFTEQYNSKGISSLLIITIDEKQPKEYIGKLENYNIYVEKLKIDELYFISVNNKQVSLKVAIDEELASVRDWRKKAWNIKKDGNIEILQYENYEIAIAYDDCIIRPITR